MREIAKARGGIKTKESDMAFHDRIELLEAFPLHGPPMGRRTYGRDNIVDTFVLPRCISGRASFPFRFEAQMLE